MNLGINFIIILMLLLSNDLSAQPGSVDTCHFKNAICIRLFDHGKLINKQNKQYSVHTSTPEYELQWEGCYWQTDSVYCFDLILYAPNTVLPYTLFIIKEKDTMQVVVKNIYYDRFYIDSVPFMPGIYEIELPLEPYSLQHKSMPELYKKGIHDCYIITPPFWKNVRIRANPKQRSTKRKNKKK